MAVPADRIPAEEYRTWRLCTLLHCLPSQLDDESALTLDWLLAVDDVAAKARATMERRAADAR
ncbi:hypothetical protein ACFC1T_14515 [Kitasatospora sp. NPDC056076]|uniref:hypothetical protein n=1 Tax=Kitasatospora sp. NPDC056076 TaxID=3345703 RepID=UPI0035E06E91